MELSIQNFVAFFESEILRSKRHPKDACSIWSNGLMTNYLTGPQEYPFYSIAQWICLVVECIFIPLYIYAATQHYALTGGFTFDTCVSLIGIILNILVLFDQFVFCIDTLVVVYEELIVIILLAFCLILIMQVYTTSLKVHREEQELSGQLYDSEMPDTVNAQPELIRRNGAYFKKVVVPILLITGLVLVAILIYSIVSQSINRGDNVYTYNWALFLSVDTILALVIMTSYCIARKQLRDFDHRLSARSQSLSRKNTSENMRESVLTNSTRLEQEDSSIVNTRRRQLKVFAWFFLIFYTLYFIIAIACAATHGNNEAIKKCFNECSVPADEVGAVFLGLKDLLTLVQIEVYWFIFYFLSIKHTSNMYSDEEHIRLLEARKDFSMSVVDQDEIIVADVQEQKETLLQQQEVAYQPQRSSMMRQSNRSTAFQKARQSQRQIQRLDSIANMDEMREHMGYQIDPLVDDTNQLGSTISQ